LPDAPEGWVMQGDDQLSVPTGLCQDYAIWPYQHTRYYQRVDDQEARDALIRESGERMMADINAKQPRLDAIMAKNVELSQTAVPAGASAPFLLRAEDKNALSDEVVLLGPWEPAPGYGLQQVIKDGMAPEKAHAISVHIYADEGRLPSVIEAIDLTALAGLIKD